MGAISVIKVLVGTIAGALFPSLSRAVENGDLGGPHQRLKRLILAARFARANSRHDEAAAARQHADIWKADATFDFYDTYALRFRELFHGPHQLIIEHMKDLCAARRVRHLVEMGCGDGQALAHCATLMPGLERLTGVDINGRIIARNRQTYAGDPRLHFSSGNAADWLAEHVSDDMMLFSYGGVMEYFDTQTLTQIFAKLAERHNTAVALVEPIDPLHDLDNDPASHVFGHELSFSHNHARLLADAGFEILFYDDQTIGAVRWLMILAAPNATVQAG